MSTISLNNVPVITEEAMARSLKGTIVYTLEDTVVKFPTKNAAKRFVSFIKTKGCFYVWGKDYHTVRFCRRNIQGGAKNGL